MDFDKLQRTQSVYCAERKCASCTFRRKFPKCQSEIEIENEQASLGMLRAIDDAFGHNAGSNQQEVSENE